MLRKFASIGGMAPIIVPMMLRARTSSSGVAANSFSISGLPSALGSARLRVTNWRPASRMAVPCICAKTVIVSLGRGKAEPRDAAMKSPRHSGSLLATVAGSASVISLTMRFHDQLPLDKDFLSGRPYQVVHNSAIAGWKYSRRISSLKYVRLSPPTSPLHLSRITLPAWYPARNASSSG